MRKGTRALIPDPPRADFDIPRALATVLKPMCLAAQNDAAPELGQGAVGVHRRRAQALRWRIVHASADWPGAGGKPLTLTQESFTDIADQI